VQFAGLGPGGQDLVITFRIHPDRVWQRNGNNVTVEHTTSVWKLIAGGTMTMMDIRGNRIELSIPSKTQPGSLLRARGRGFPDRNGNIGDMLVRIQAEIPGKISEELLAAIQAELAK
jgi:molecular chaperone DnaJ